MQDLVDSSYYKDLMGGGAYGSSNNEELELKRKQLKAREDYYKQESNRRANDYFDKIPEGVDIAKVPPVYKDKVADWNDKNMRDVYRLKKLVRETEAGSPANMQYRKELAKIKRAAENLNANFTKFKQYKTDYLKVETQGAMSSANSGKNLDLLSQVYTDKMGLQINSKGEIYFTNDSGYISFDDLPDYDVKDSDAATKILEMNSAAFNAKAPMSRNAQNLYRIKLNKLVGNINTARSLAADDLIIPGGLGAPYDLLHNPDRQDELRQFVVNSYMKGLQDSATEGYKIALNKTKTRGGGGTASGRKYNARLNNMLAGWDALSNGDASVLDRFLTGNDEIMPSEEEEGLFEYYNGNQFKLIDPNDPKDLYYILSGQGIPDDLWPQVNNNAADGEMTAQDYINKYSK